MITLLERNARVSGSADGLTQILDDQCNLAIWERPTLAGVAALLEGAPADVRFETSLAALQARLRTELRKAGFAAEAVQSQLIDDVSQLAAAFGSIARLDALEIRLEVVTTDSCRKFHADYVRARLITTYCGAGTQWLDNDDAALVQQGLEPRHIHALTEGDVGIFKGKLATSAPIIHRSPPIAGTGEKRLLLVINPAEDMTIADRC